MNVVLGLECEAYMLVGSCVVRMVVVCNLHSEEDGSNSVEIFCWVFGSSKVGLCLCNE